MTGPNLKRFASKKKSVIQIIRLVNPKIKSKCEKRRQYVLPKNFSPNLTIFKPSFV